MSSQSKQSSVKLQITFLMIFGGIFFAGDKVLARIIDQAYVYSSMPDAMLYSERGKANVVILGNSRAYHHFDDKVLSQELGLNVKTYAIEAASMEYNEVILKDYIDIYGAPDTVILELSCLTWDNGQFMNMRSLSLRSEYIDGVLKKDYPKAYYAGKFFNLFNYNSTSFLNVLHKIVVKYEQPMLSGQVNLDELNELINAEPDKYFLNKEDSFKSLKNIQELSKTKNFKLHLIVTPFLKEFIDVQPEYDRWINLVEEGMGNDTLIYDYGRKIVDSSYFKDLTHLNEYGVKKLHQILKNDGFYSFAQ